MPVAAPAIPPNPSKPAIKAITKNIMVYLSIKKPPLTSLFYIYPIHLFVDIYCSLI